MKIFSSNLKIYAIFWSMHAMHVISTFTVKKEIIRASFIIWVFNNKTQKSDLFFKLLEFCERIWQSKFKR